MFVYPDLNPVAISIGPINIYWYGLMYLLSFILGWALAIRRTRLAHIHWQREEVTDYLFYVVLGVVLGGRIGYMLFYQFGTLLHQPLQLFYVWDGGMSFHGGLLGVTLTTLWFARKTQRSFWSVIDFVAPIIPIGLFFGRIANFINGELVGRITDVPWAMIYPHIGPQPRHPSELYEAILEGPVLFILLIWFAHTSRPRMAVGSLFLLGYGVFRFTAEFFRQPDAHMGFIAFDWLTMGQLLSLPMIMLGLLFLLIAYKRQPKNS